MAENIVVGVDLGGTKVKVGTVADGAVQKLYSRRVSAREAEEVVLGEVIGAIEQVLEPSVVGIGCGVPSVVDVETGTVFEVENIPSWHRVPLKAVLEERFSVPVIVNNDANAFAVGEHVFGSGRRFRNLVGMTLGTGLGAGVIIDGRLYSGTNCGAGEIGMIPHKGRTVEAWCSGQFFERECGADGEEVYRRARAGDAAAIDCYARYGRELANAIMIALYAFDPQAVILGGSISAAFDLFEGTMWEHLERFAYSHLLERLAIDKSELENAAVLGAAALYIDATGGRRHLRLGRGEE